MGNFGGYSKYSRIQIFQNEWFRYWGLFIYLNLVAFPIGFLIVRFILIDYLGYNE